MVKGVGFGFVFFYYSFTACLRSSGFIKVITLWAADRGFCCIVPGLKGKEKARERMKKRARACL